MNWYGYTGKILEINLSDEKISVIGENVKDVKKFLGGIGMNFHLGAERLKPRTKPLSPDNIIVLGTGPMVGTIMPGASRTSGLSKFPATGAIASVCGGMSFGFHLKQAGYDHVILSGKADKPTYLFIFDDHIDLVNADKIWGLDLVETTNLMWKKYDDCGVIAIGQAGENLVFGALTLIDKTSTFGRGGLGAIMGSKNLKAIVVKGSKGIEIANPKQFNKLYEAFIDRVRKYPHRDSWIELGMLRSLPVGMLLNAKGEKKKARQCSDRNYLKYIKKRRIGCPSCPMADKDILEIREGEFKGLLNYTSSIINPLLMLTSDGLSSYDQAIKIFDLISRYGLDSLTITSLFDFISRMIDLGYLTNKDLDGYEWKKDFKTYEHLIEIITHRNGIGNILADGWKEIARLNDRFEEEMLTIKGLDVIFEPRFLKLGTMEFEQVVNPKGAHVASGGSPTYVGAGGGLEKMKSHFNRMGIPESAIDGLFKPPKEEMGINVGRLTRYSEDWYTILTSFGLCARAQMNRFYSLELITSFYNSITGLNLNSNEIRLAAERSWNLMKLMNVKEGFSRQDDAFPKNWFKSLKYGENELEFYDFYGNVKINRDIANQLLEDYYDERGWDKEIGTPSSYKLKELGLTRYI
ncbi:MAG: aldehyde ferredoxin oxidoreductase N-terminal domain-containing protein [Promethearchaeota archaeon]